MLVLKVESRGQRDWPLNDAIKQPPYSLDQFRLQLTECLVP